MVGVFLQIRYGESSIKLDFRISKQGTDVTKESTYNGSALGWDPGVKV